MTDTPWSGLTPASSPGELHAIRVDPDIRWAFFWALDSNGKYLLVLNHSTAAGHRVNLPRLKSIEIAHTENPTTEQHAITFTLLADDQLPLFQTLCQDIVSSTSEAASEDQAIEAALRRTWRWHHLLRGVGSGLLSLEEQRGLLGELEFIRNWLQPNFNYPGFIGVWRGPLDSPKDFEISKLSVEVKARRSRARPEVGISSEFQLDDPEHATLYLYVIDVDQVPTPADSSITLTSAASSIMNTLGSSVDIDRFEELLAAAGFRWDDDYSEFNWVTGEECFYRVEAGFPRLTSSGVPPGVSNVHYSVNLQLCNDYLVQTEEFRKGLKGSDNHGA